MRRKEYLKPEVDELETVLSSIICTSPGIDPVGIGQDFNWGNGIGIIP